jgi:Winged helix DNA-binding domain
MICGAQAQDVYAGPLTFRSRSSRLTALDVHRARTEERSLLRTWVMRKTIQMIPSDDAEWVLPLFEPMIEKWSRRRLQQLGLPEAKQERALRAIGRALEMEGPMTRSEACERVEVAGVPLDNQTRLHVTMLAVTSGLACLGPDAGRQACLVLRRDWLGELPQFDRGAALAELARRYVRGFAPATDRDLAAWAGLGLREARAGLDAISSELVEVRVGDVSMVAPAKSSRRPPKAPQVRLLGAFDTYLLGYANRDFAVAPLHRSALKEGGGGWIRPVIVRDGEVIGGWRYARRQGRVEVTIGSHASLPPETRSAVDREVADIARFEGLETTLIRDGN